MSNENDVPLGEGSRRYYEELFAGRIRQVNKGGDAPRNDSGSSSGFGRAGCGGVIVIFLIIRILLVVFRTQSTPSTHIVSVPPPPRFDPEMQKLPDDWGLPPVERVEEANVLLEKEDIPLLEGLCYRIDRESRQQEPTPGKHICALLPPNARPLIRKAAGREILRGEEQDQLVEALEEVLHDAKFYDGPSFQHVPGMALLMLQSGNGRVPALGTARFHRLVLEKCYPRQIVPLHERGHLNAQGRERWQLRAQMDLNQARQEHN